MFYLSIKESEELEKQQQQPQPVCRELAIHQINDLMYSSIPILIVCGTAEDGETVVLIISVFVYIKNIESKTPFLFIDVKGETYEKGLRFILNSLKHEKIDIGVEYGKDTWKIVKQKLVSKFPVNAGFIIYDVEKTDRELLKWIKQLNRPIIMTTSTPQPQLKKIFPNLRTFNFTRPFKEMSN